MIKKLLIVLAVLTVGAAGAWFYLQQSEENQLESSIQLVADNANDLPNSIRSLFSSHSPVTRVYDLDMNLMMTVKSNPTLSAVTAVPQAVSEKILSQGDVYETVALDYIRSTNLEATDIAKAGYIRRLKSEFSENDLVRYLASTSMFADAHLGLQEAAHYFFSCEVEQLTGEQAQQLANAYRNPSATIERAENTMQSNASLKDMILREMRSIEGVDMELYSYNIQVSINSSQQSKIQSVIDSEMRQFLDLSSNGEYQLDASVVLVDGNGRVRVCIPRRTSMKQSETEFKMNSLNFLDNLRQFLTDMDNPTESWISLREVTLQNGDKVYKTLRELFDSSSLAPMTTVQNASSLDVLNTLYSSSEYFEGFGVIQEVQTVLGDVVYRRDTSKNPSIKSDPATAVKVCEFLKDDEGTSWGFDITLPTGVVSLHQNSSYTLVVLTGSNALGVNLNTDTLSKLSTIYSSVEESVKGDYPADRKPLWVQNFQGIVEASYGYNLNILQPEYTKLNESLHSVEVSSRDTRLQWEEAYTKLTTFLSAYKQYLSESVTAYWIDDLNNYRLEMQDTLLRYST